MLRRHGVALLAVAVASIFCIPSLTLGLGTDEFERLSVLEGAAPKYLPWNPLQLSRFARGTPEELAAISRDIHEGSISWACVPRPGKLMFFRPLASADTWVDHGLFGLEPLGYHAHAILLFLALILALYLLYRQVLPEEPVAGLRCLPVYGLALLLFVGDPTHLEVIQRVTCREYLLAGLFGVMGLMAHVSWREGRWAPGRLVSPACFALAFLAGEMALQLVAFLGAYELFGSTGSWRRRVAALAPVGLIVGAVVLHFKLEGYGSDVYGYLDPTADLGAWSRVAPRIFSELTLEEVVGVPRFLVWLGWRANGLDLAVLEWKAGPALVVIAAALVLGLLGLLLRDAAGTAGSPKRRNTWWLAAGAALSLLPVLRENASPRLLFLPSIGFSAVLALALDALLRYARGGRAGAPRSLLRRTLSGVSGVLAIAWGMVLLVGGPASSLKQLLLYRQDQRSLYEFNFFTKGTRLATDAQAKEAPLASMPEETIVLTAPYQSVYWPLYSEFTRVVDESGRRVRVKHLSFLSTARSDHELLRTGEDTFQLTLRENSRFPWEQNRDFSWIDSLQVCVLPVADLQPQGAQVETRTLRIHVREVAGDDRIRSIDVTRLTPSESTWFAVWRQGELHRIRLPEPGERLLLPLDIEP